MPASRLLILMFIGTPCTILYYYLGLNKQEGIEIFSLIPAECKRNS